MRFILFYSNDVYSNKIVAAFIKNAEISNKLVCIFVSKKVLNKNTLLKTVKDLFRQCDFIFLIINLYISIIDKFHRLFFKKPDTLKIAKKIGCLVYKTSDFNNKESVKLLARLKPDFIINRANQILREDVLQIARYGCLNVHCSLLPDYKGWVSNFWALLNDEYKVGVTLHTMTEVIDEGLIVRQEAFTVNPTDSYLKLQLKSSVLATKILVDFVNSFSHSLDTKPFRKGGSGYFGFPDRNTVREFQTKNKLLISKREALNLLFKGL